MCLNLKLETDQILNKKVKDIVGEDVMNIFGNAVEEAELDTEEVVENNQDIVSMEKKGSADNLYQMIN